MKHLLIVPALVAGLTGTAYAQAASPSDQELIERAVAAAPANARAGAMVVKWDDAGKRVVVREGKNGLACWDQSVWPGQRPFSSRCTSAGNLARIEQNRSFFYQAKEAKAAEALIQEAEKNKTRVVPEYGAAYYSLVGNDQASARGHVTIATPFATTETLKLPSKPTVSGAWIMDAGTSAAHIMVPGH